MKLTQQQRLEAALLDRGYVRDTEARTVRYLTFIAGPGARTITRTPDMKVLLGELGALRFTWGPVYASVPFADAHKARLLAEGDRVLKIGEKR